MSEPLVFDREKALRCYGSQAILEQVITQYLEEADGMMAKLRGALQAGDRTEVRRVVHWFRGGLSYLFAPATEKACLELDRLSQQEPMPPLMDTFSELERELHRLQDELRLSST